MSNWKIPKGSHLDQNKICAKKTVSLCCLADIDEDDICVQCNNTCKSGVVLQSAFSDCHAASILIIDGERICFICKKPCRALAVSNL